VDFAPRLEVAVSRPIGDHDILALALHILGAIVWFGGMFAIYMCLCPSARHARAAAAATADASHAPEAFSQTSVRNTLSGDRLARDVAMDVVFPLS
jgi:hypothetical protein